MGAVCCTAHRGGLATAATLISNPHPLQTSRASPAIVLSMPFAGACMRSQYDEEETGTTAPWVQLTWARPSLHFTANRLTQPIATGRRQAREGDRHHGSCDDDALSRMPVKRQERRGLMSVVKVLQQHSTYMYRQQSCPPPECLFEVAALPLFDAKTSEARVTSLLAAFAVSVNLEENITSSRIDRHLW